MTIRLSDADAARLRLKLKGQVRMTYTPKSADKDLVAVGNGSAIEFKIKKSRAPKIDAPLERDVQSSIIEWLTFQGWKVVRHHPTAPRAGVFTKVKDDDKGFPDLMAYSDTAHLLIEVKRPGGLLSEHQKRMHTDPRIKPWSMVAYSLQDVVDEFKRRGFAVRGTR